MRGKSVRFGVAWIAALAVLFFVKAAVAQTIVTQAISQPRNILMYYVSFTASAGGVITSATDISPGDGIWCFLGVTNPGATAPTDNWDVLVYDSMGADIFGGELVNRDTSNSEQATPRIGNTYGARYVPPGLMYISISGNVNANANGEVVIYCTVP